MSDVSTFVFRKSKKGEFSVVIHDIYFRIGNEAV